MYQPRRIVVGIFRKPLIERNFQTTFLHNNIKILLVTFNEPILFLEHVRRIF